jgi:hypothetical protein
MSKKFGVVKKDKKKKIKKKRRKVRGEKLENKSRLILDFWTGSHVQISRNAVYCSDGIPKRGSD